MAVHFLKKLLLREMLVQDKITPQPHSVAVNDSVPVIKYAARLMIRS